jgi:hypothetical protein
LILVVIVLSPVFPQPGTFRAAVIWSKSGQRVAATQAVEFSSEQGSEPARSAPAKPAFDFEDHLKKASSLRQQDVIKYM